LKKFETTYFGLKHIHQKADQQAQGAAVTASGAFLGAASFISITEMVKMQL
jgi:hypothetical protein